MLSGCSSDDSGCEGLGCYGNDDFSGNDDFGNSCLDTCEYANDGVCDEGMYCEHGSDCSDCGGQSDPGNGSDPQQDPNDDDSCEPLSCDGTRVRTCSIENGVKRINTSQCPVDCENGVCTPDAQTAAERCCQHLSDNYGGGMIDDACWESYEQCEDDNCYGRIYQRHSNCRIEIEW